MTAKFRNDIIMINTPHPVDVYVGKRIRVRRRMLGMNQTVLGEQLGVTFQQVQKYERGANRVSSSSLFRTANALDVPVSFFFEGAETCLPDYNPKKNSADNDIRANQETIELVEAYYSISDPRVRKKIVDLARLLNPEDGS